MPSVKIEPVTPVIMRQQTYALERMATWIDLLGSYASSTECMHDIQNKLIFLLFIHK